MQSEHSNLLVTLVLLCVNNPRLGTQLNACLFRAVKPLEGEILCGLPQKRVAVLCISRG